MQVGDLLTLHSSSRRNGVHAGKLAVVVEIKIGTTGCRHPVVCVGGDKFVVHQTQIGTVLTNEGR